MDEKQVPAISCLDDLIRQLHVVFQSDCINVEYVSALLAAYKSNLRDWKQYAIFDPHRYTRNLVDSGNDRFNLMALCWGEGHGSSVHDHTDAHCFVKVLDGQLKETMFDWPTGSRTRPASEHGGSDVDLDDAEEEPLRQKTINYYDKDGVTYINDTMGLHRVENSSHTNPAVSLHLYSPPFQTCQSFDQRTGRARAVRMTFWSEYGRRTLPAVANANASATSTTAAAAAAEPRKPAMVRMESMNSGAVVQTTSE